MYFNQNQTLVKVVNVMTGETKTYESIAECARSFNVSTTCVKNYLDTGRTFNGCRFSRAGLANPKPDPGKPLW